MARDREDLLAIAGHRGHQWQDAGRDTVCTWMLQGKHAGTYIQTSTDIAQCMSPHISPYIQMHHAVYCTMIYFPRTYYILYHTRTEPGSTNSRLPLWMLFSTCQLCQSSSSMFSPGGGNPDVSFLTLPCLAQRAQHSNMMRLLKLGIFHWPMSVVDIIPMARETPIPLISLQPAGTLPLRFPFSLLLAVRAVIVTSHRRGDGKAWHKSRKRPNERPCHSIPGTHTHNIPRTYDSTSLWNLCPEAAILGLLWSLLSPRSPRERGPRVSPPLPTWRPQGLVLAKVCLFHSSLVRGFGRGFGFGTTTHALQ
jgi:hypothetical protein